VTLSRETIAQLAPSPLENCRSTRYRADEQAIELSALAPADRPVVVQIYAMLQELEGIVGGDAGLDDPAPLLAFVARHDVGELVHRIRRLGAEQQDDEHLAEAIHDIRGGALSALVVHLLRLGRVPYRSDIARTLFIATRDHMKMMRNVLRDLDLVARERDLTLRPHSLGELARALREFTATAAGDEPVVVAVDCTVEGIIAESCVECAAIDRVAYNLLNNAARYASRPTIDAWLLTTESDLRVAIANSISPEQRSVVTEQLAASPTSLFGSFTTSGSGYGLRIVSELVGRAYGIASIETLTKAGYVGARVVDDSFVTWFHWPLAGA
jgi:signal transduction histidine kinase